MGAEESGAASDGPPANPRSIPQGEFSATADSLGKWSAIGYFEPVAERSLETSVTFVWGLIQIVVRPVPISVSAR
jgi:hypothetical protein